MMKKSIVTNTTLFVVLAITMVFVDCSKKSNPINPINPPVLGSIGPKSVNEGSDLTFRVHATDADGDNIVLSATNNIPTNTTFIDSSNGAGSFNFSPDYTQAGVYNVTFKATDPSLAVDSEVVQITVNNDTGQCDIYDDFTGTSINTGIWNVVNGSWSQNDQLTGYWSISAAQTDQGNILLVNGLQSSGDYTVEVDEVVNPFGQYKNGHRYVLYHSPGNKYNMQFGCENASFGLESREGESNYHNLVSIYSIPYFNTVPGQVNHTKLVRAGNHFKCYLNDHLIYEFDETIFGGVVKIGLGCYGTATYDNFCLTKNQ